MFRPFFFLYMSAYFLPLIILKLLPVKVYIGVADFVNGFLSSFSAIMICYVAYIFMKMMLSKQKTTFRFILKTQYLGVILLVLGIFIGGVFNEKGEMNPIYTGFVSAGFSVVFICHYFYKKHLDVIHKQTLL